MIVFKNGIDLAKINQRYNFFLLGHLFRRKSQAIVIARSSLSSSCKNFNVAHYSKSIKLNDINIKLGILAYHDKMQLKAKWHNSENYSFRVMPPFSLNVLSRMMAPDR